MSEFHHVSVMLRECIDGLNIRPEGIYVDGTLGGAGHSYQIASRLTTGKLIGIDRDNVALAAAGERLAPCRDRVHPGPQQLLTDLPRDPGRPGHLAGVDGMLLGSWACPAPQLDDGARGFSYMSGRAPGYAHGP